MNRSRALDGDQPDVLAPVNSRGTKQWACDMSHLVTKWRKAVTEVKTLELICVYAPYRPVRRHFPILRER